MPNFELDKWAIAKLHDLHSRGPLDIRPPYQRGTVLSDAMRHSLIDTVRSDYPMGVILLNVINSEDTDGTPIETWDTVDGQQRCTTLFDYLRGEANWTKGKSPSNPDFTRFDKLTDAQQDRVNDYLVPVALMKEFTESEVRDVFIRIQYGRALSIGEKIKALNSPYHSYLQELVENSLFEEWGSPHQKRDAHWSLAAVFLQAIYNDQPLARQEYPLLARYLQNETKGFLKIQARQATAETKSVMNYMRRIIIEALQINPGFKAYVPGQRLMKWLFPTVALLKKRYAISGKEPDVAKGILAYYQDKDKEGTDEFDAYFRTLRSGRIDTNEVKACLEQLMNRIIIHANLAPLDTTRFFSAQARQSILDNSGSKCQGMVQGQRCNTNLSSTNYHADHIVPHSLGGQTKIANGQALCSACNRAKGAQSALSQVFS